jgi:GNAT superfamily N-acetyltransferase
MPVPDSCVMIKTVRMHATIRTATLDDVPMLKALIAHSVMRLQAADYSVEQRAGALGTVFGVDRQLILDGTYFVAEVDSKIVACGGWSRRKTLFGSDHSPAKNDSWLNPSADAARIRAFFVHPAWARRGLGSQIMQACEAAAVECGFSRLELVATLTGEALYRKHGFLSVEQFEVPLGNGATLPVIRMTKSLLTI